MHVSHMPAVGGNANFPIDGDHNGTYAYSRGSLTPEIFSVVSPTVKQWGIERYKDFLDYEFSGADLCG